jgi:diphosphomevalonate decarboxylase
MSAYALCLINIEKDLTGRIYFIDDFYKKASFIARIGSGSAARSVYGGINIWGELPDNESYSNEYANEISKNCHPLFVSYQDAILIVSDKTKKVSSTVGHGLMNNHPYASEKFRQGNKNAKKLLKILEKGNQKDFIELVEEEALALHAMMMTSNPSFLLMEPNTLEIINKIRHFRESSQVPVCFTLDAGANVHLLYPEINKEKVLQFIEHELSPLCYNRKWINDCVGKGPQIIQ